MKEIRREKERVEVTIKYESADGKVFENKEDCEKWEKSYECTIRAALKKIPYVDTYTEEVYIISPPDNRVLVLKPRNIEDINVINAYHDMIDNNGNRLTHEDIGKTIMLETGYEEECCYIYRAEKYLQSIIDSFKRIEKQIEDFEEE